MVRAESVGGFLLISKKTFRLLSILLDIHKYLFIIFMYSKFAELNWKIVSLFANPTKDTSYHQEPMQQPREQNIAGNIGVNGEMGDRGEHWSK